MTTMAQNSSTFNSFCACGCGASVKPGQRWREPACKARVYRARQRATREQEQQELWNGVDRYLQLEEERDNLADRLKALEEVYSELWEQHQHCRRATPVSKPQQRSLGDAFAILGMRPDAELEAIDGAYKALAKKYHPDRHPGDPVMDTRMKTITAAYAQVMRMRGRKR
jgi:DnaJ-domain-containing protein 1